MIRVIVVHQSKLIASVIGSVLSEEPGIFVAGKAVDVQGALGRIELSGCNMLLVAASLPDDGALELTKTVARDYDNVKVLVIGVPESEHVILQYVMAGAAGYVLQDVSKEQLLENVRAAACDEALISPTIAATLMQQVAELAQIAEQYELEPEAVEELTPREREVLQLVGEDLTNQEIADRLIIELGTVKNHVHNILKKLDVNSRTEAAAYLSILDDEPNQKM